jgi:hypothetical protein
VLLYFFTLDHIYFQENMLTSLYIVCILSSSYILLVDETGVPGENHRPVVSHLQALSHNVVSSTSRNERDTSSIIYKSYI